MNKIVRIECAHGSSYRTWDDMGNVTVISCMYWREARRKAWALSLSHGLAPTRIEGGVTVVWGE